MQVMAMTRVRVTKDKFQNRWLARILAEIMVGVRFLMGALVLWLGIIYFGTLPSFGLICLIIFNMIGWTTDFLDGPLARYSKIPPGILGKNDFIADMFFAWMNALAISLMGLFHPVILIAYFILYLVVWYWYRKKLVSMIFAVPVEALPFFTVLFYFPWWALIYLVWILVCFLLLYRRVWDVFVEVTKK